MKACAVKFGLEEASDGHPYPIRPLFAPVGYRIEAIR
jgi:hypothetical protein